MKKDIDSIDEFFKSQFESERKDMEINSSKIWAKIEEKRKPKMKIAWLRFSAVAGVLLVMGLLFVYDFELTITKKELVNSPQPIFISSKERDLNSPQPKPYPRTALFSKESSPPSPWRRRVGDEVNKSEEIIRLNLDIQTITLKNELLEVEAKELKPTLTLENRTVAIVQPKRVLHLNELKPKTFDLAPASKSYTFKFNPSETTQQTEFEESGFRIKLKKELNN